MIFPNNTMNMKPLILMLAMATAAALPPALRAARVDPMSIMRGD